MSFTNWKYWSCWLSLTINSPYCCPGTVVGLIWKQSDVAGDLFPVFSEQVTCFDLITVLRAFQRAVDMDAWYRLDEEGILEDKLIDSMWKDIWEDDSTKKDTVVCLFIIYLGLRVCVGGVDVEGHNMGRWTDKERYSGILVQYLSRFEGVCGWGIMWKDIWEDELTKKDTVVCLFIVYPVQNIKHKRYSH